MKSKPVKLKKIGGVRVLTRKDRVRIVHVDSGGLTVDGTRDSATVTVTCTLEGKDTGGHMVSRTKGATGTSPTTWHCDFGSVPDGCYRLTAKGSDGSKDGTDVEVGSGKCT